MNTPGETTRAPGLEPVGFVLVDAGVTDYDVMYETQRSLVDKKRANPEDHDYLILVEHPDVYTYGRKSKIPSPEQFTNAFEVERGGEVTYHNPGQLVGYPILKLRENERDLHLHLRRLEWTLIDVLRDFGLNGERREGATGVWLQGKQKKIASIGVAVSSWVTYHGCALNVNNDLSGFTRINPCGFSAEVMTSLQEQLGESCPTMSDVKESFLNHFGRNFSRLLII